MSIEEEVFAIQLEKGVYEDAEVPFAKGLAQLSVDKGYDELSSKQKAILAQYLSVCCSGHTDPGGNFNECKTVMEGNDLLEAYQLSYDSGSLKCESCSEEESFQAHQWQKILDE